MNQELSAYIKLPKYRKTLKLPENAEERYELLAQGEYNRNYLFTHPITGEKLVFRVNFGSQMHLEDQIGYEYQALKLLENSGRTPRPFYVDSSCTQIPNGVMVMEYLPGRPLDYKKDLQFAADCLADIHAVKISNEKSLISPVHPLKAILDECEEMFRKYEESPLCDRQKAGTIRRMLKKGWKRVNELPETPYKCCINTELNSTNFLINGYNRGNYLIDWEKPLYGDPAQDLGHFLAPTTTFWKTDVILEKNEMEMFIQDYIQKVGSRFDVSGLEERTNIYIPVTCLRGITWCAMAWIEYKEPGKEIFNLSTFHKLEQYLDMEFLDRIEQFIDQ